MKNENQYPESPYFNSSLTSRRNNKLLLELDGIGQKQTLLYNEVYEEYEELREKERDRYCFFILHLFFIYFIQIVKIIPDINIKGCE